jgi:hypothetical protein
MKNPYLLYIFLSAFLFHKPCSSQTLSVLAPGNAFVSVPLTGVVWNNTGNVAFSDDNRASAGYSLGLLGTMNTDYLKTGNYNFAVPPGSVITGIQVEIERRGQGIVVGSSIHDKAVQLVKSGVGCGTNKASITPWTAFDIVASYGGPGDLWGTTWLPEEINAPDFGLLFSAQLNAGLASVFLEAQIDLIQLTVYYNVMPLPIELLSFDLSVLENKKVKVDWTTASEHNNFYFEIQRSENGTEWKSIKTIDGAGNSDVALAYSIVDEKALDGLSFYRLKQTDYDGTMKFGAIKSVNIISEKAKITIGPNPADNKISLNCAVSNDISITLCIYDLHGNLVKQSDVFDVKKGSPLSVDIQITELSQGMYFYKASAGNEIMAGKIVKN